MSDHEQHASIAIDIFTYMIMAGTILTLFIYWIPRCQSRCSKRQANLVIKSPTKANDWSPDTNV